MAGGVKLREHSNRLKKYYALIKIQFKDNFAYRMSTFASIIVGILQVYIFYYIWCRVYDGTDTLKQFSLTQMSTYVILSNAIYKLMEFGITLRIADMVKSGEIATKLTKPIGFIPSLFFESIGSLAASIFTMILPILVFCILSLDIFIQRNLWANVMFAGSVFFAILISIYVDIIFGLLTFWTENGWGLRVIRQALVKLFSGAVVPLAFLPEWFTKICDVLPFKTLIDVPIRIYLFGVSNEAIENILVQLLWVVLLMVFTKLLFQVIMKKIQINGG